MCYILYSIYFEILLIYKGEKFGKFELKRITVQRDVGATIRCTVK